MDNDSFPLKLKFFLRVLQLVFVYRNLPKVLADGPGILEKETHLQATIYAEGGTDPEEAIEDDGVAAIREPCQCDFLP